MERTLWVILIHRGVDDKVETSFTLWWREIIGGINNFYKTTWGKGSTRWKGKMIQSIIELQLYCTGVYWVFHTERIYTANVGKWGSIWSDFAFGSSLTDKYHKLVILDRRSRFQPVDRVSSNMFVWIAASQEHLSFNLLGSSGVSNTSGYYSSGDGNACIELIRYLLFHKYKQCERICYEFFNTFGQEFHANISILSIFY